MKFIIDSGLEIRRNNAKRKQNQSIKSFRSESDESSQSYAVLEISF